MTEYLLLAAAMMFTGGIGGILAGMLGIGGAIVIVPVLDAALAFLGVDADIRMHVAVATSLATIVPTSIASSRAHHRRSAVDLALVRRWAIFVLAGSIMGVLIASRVHSDVLAVIFASMALIFALKLILPLDGITFATEVPRGPLVPLAPAAVGAISSMMGIGGGTLSVAALTLCGVPIHRAVGTAALFGLAISVPGAISFMLVGYGDPRLPPGSIGYVNLPGFALIASTTYLAAPLGASLAHKLSQRTLSLVFGVFLLLAAIRMFLSVMLEGS